MKHVAVEAEWEFDDVPALKIAARTAAEMRSPDNKPACLRFARQAAAALLRTA